MFHRLCKPLRSNSFFLFGARGTGKSTLLEGLFGDKNQKTLWIDLLNPVEEDLFSRDPNELQKRVVPYQKMEWVVIDEVQKVPALLNVVHSLIEKQKIKFALTGSSARKLKHGSANLLAGRAFVNYLHPLTHVEMGSDFQLETALSWGSLPKITQLKTHEEKAEFLRAYSLSYLKEEVWAEHMIRQLDPFRRFLEIAAQANGDIVNFSNIARDIGIDTKTVQSYFQILEDTLVGLLLEPYHRSVRKRQMQNPKFYFFDLGVKRSLSREFLGPILPGSSSFGRAFEHFLILEISRLNDYFKKDYRLSYLRTKDNAEIDLVLERPGLPLVLIEIKSSKHTDERDVKTLKSFAKDIKHSKAYVFSQDPHRKKIEGIECLPWDEGLKEIGLQGASN